MPNKKGIAYYKDWIYIIILAITILGYGARFVLMSDQVKRNEAEITELKTELEKANLEVLNYRLGEIETKVGVIYEYIMKQ